MKFFFVANLPSRVMHVTGAAVAGTKHALEKLGQVIDVELEEAEHHIRGGCALLTQEEWDSCGITPEEVKKYDTAGKRWAMSKEFEAKMRKAWTIAAQKHMDLNGFKNPDPNDPPAAPDSKPYEALIAQ